MRYLLFSKRAIQPKLCRRRRKQRRKRFNSTAHSLYRTLSSLIKRQFLIGIATKRGPTLKKHFRKIRNMLKATIGTPNISTALSQTLTEQWLKCERQLNLSRWELMPT